MAGLRVIRMDDFTGGLNLRADPFQLAQNESPDMLNVDVDPLGGFSSRAGVQRLNTSAIGSIANGSFTPEKLFYWNATSPQLMVAANGKVFYASTTSFTDTTITTTFADGASFAPWTGTTPSGTPISALYVACGTSTTQAAKWDGSTKTLLTASGTGNWQTSLASPTTGFMPRSDLVATHNDRMWVASTYENAAGFPNRIRWSHPNYPESWREQDYIDVVQGGSGITALVPFGGALFIFKKHSVHALYGYDTDTFQLVTLTESIGALSSNCVAASERGLYFFHWPDGLFVYDGNGFESLFDKLRPIITSGEVNASALGSIWLSHVNNRLWLALPCGEDNTVATRNYVYDPSIKAWTKYQFGTAKKALTAMADFVTSTGTRYSLGLHADDPYVVRVDDPTLEQDDITGTPESFESYYVTRWHDADIVSAKKMWRRPDMIVNQPTVDTTLTVQVYHNWEEALVKRTAQILISAGSQNALTWRPIGSEPDAYDGWGQAPWGVVAEGAQFQRGANLGLARAVQLKINGELGKPWGVNSISYKYNPRKVR